MKIITWNCNMAFRNKMEPILNYNPDILVVQECEHPDNFDLSSIDIVPTDILWFGTNRNKGLGVFAFNDYKLSLLDNRISEFKMILPIHVNNGESDFTLYAVWANNPKDPDGHYIEQVWKALNHYESILTGNKTILIGDFNSNTIWDRKYRVSNHSNVVKRLEIVGIHSAYHLHHQQIQGKELHPTLYMYRHKNKPYHIDYCFASKDLIDKIEEVEIGDFESWNQYSDHVPLIVTFKTEL